MPLSCLEVPGPALWPVVRYLARRRGVTVSEVLPQLRVEDVTALTRDELLHVHRMGSRKLQAWEIALAAKGFTLSG